jgi:hypothetical protein
MSGSIGALGKALAKPKLWLRLPLSAADTAVTITEMLGTCRAGPNRHRHSSPCGRWLCGALCWSTVVMVILVMLRAAA